PTEDWIMNGKDSGDAEYIHPLAASETFREVVLSSAPAMAGTIGAVSSGGNPIASGVAIAGINYVCRKHPRVVVETVAFATPVAFGLGLGVASILISLAL